MIFNRWKAGAIVLMALCTMASLPTLAASKGRIFTPDGELVYVNVYSTDPNTNQDFLYNYVAVYILPEIKRVRGVGVATILGNRGYVMRIRLNPDHMRAQHLTSDDIKKAFIGCSILGSSERLTKTEQLTEYELTHVGRFNKPKQYEDIILKASPDGEILRLKDVGRVELESSFNDMTSGIDGHPAATLVLKLASDSNASEVIEAVQEKLDHIKKEWFPPRMGLQVIPFDSRDMVYAVIQTTRDSTLEFTSARCDELGAIARGVDGIISVTSLAGYQIRTDGRDSNVGTCLIRLKDRSDRKLTSRQIIETLEEKCRTTRAHVEFFEPPAFSVFVAAGGFSVRVLDRTNTHSNVRTGSGPETFVDVLLKRKNLETLFQFFASNYSQSELVIDNDVARQRGVSIADAMEGRFKVVGGDVQSGAKLQRLAEDFSHPSFKNDRGEMVPYSTFMQLKMKRGLLENDR